MIARLAEWGVWGTDAQEILLKLIEQNYVNEERFAIAYAGGKFRVKRWGRIRIRQGLKQHEVSDYCINRALAGIDGDEYLRVLEEELQKKWAAVKAPDLFLKKSKVAQYLTGKGYESDLVWQALHDMEP